MRALRASCINLKGLFEMEINAVNVNQLFSEMLWKFKIIGKAAKTRNGDALYIEEPVLTKVLEPCERVLFYDRRDANPIFHLMESIWMLAGRNDVHFVEQFNSKIGQFSDDGRVFNAAYGHRMRSQFGVDQLLGVIEHLRADPDSRQAVIQLWDANDLLSDTRDRACNTQMIFSVRHGRLNLMVNNRSNDFWWGYAGANIVHFTMIQEFVAIALDLPVGVYYTVSNNLHVYKDLYNAAPDLEFPPDARDFDHYSANVVKPYELYQGDHKTFLYECEQFCDNPYKIQPYEHAFFNDVAIPMATVAFVRKHKISNGFKEAEKIKALDWKLATVQWIMRREKANVSK